MLRAITGRAVADRSERKQFERDQKRLEQKYSHVPAVLRDVTHVQSEGIAETPPEQSTITYRSPPSVHSTSSAESGPQPGESDTSDDTFAEIYNPPPRAPEPFKLKYPSRPGRPNLLHTTSDLSVPTTTSCTESDHDTDCTSPSTSVISKKPRPRHQSFDDVWISKHPKLPPFPPTIGFGKYERYVGAGVEFQKALLDKHLLDVHGAVLDTIDDEFALASLDSGVWQDFKRTDPRVRCHAASPSYFNKRSQSERTFTDEESGTHVQVGFGPLTGSSISGSERGSVSDHECTQTNSYISMTSIKEEIDRNHVLKARYRHDPKLDDVVTSRKLTRQSGKFAVEQKPTLTGFDAYMNAGLAGRPRTKSSARRCIFSDNDTTESAIVSSDEEEDDELIEKRDPIYIKRRIVRGQTTLPEPPRFISMAARVRAETATQSKPVPVTRVGFRRSKSGRAVIMPRLLRRKSHKTTDDAASGMTEDAHAKRREVEVAEETDSNREGRPVNKAVRSDHTNQRGDVQNISKDEHQASAVKEDVGYDSGDDGPADLASFMVESRAKCKSSTRMMLDADQASMMSKSTNKTITPANFYKPVAAVVTAFRSGKERAGHAFRQLGNEICDIARSKDVSKTQDEP